RGFLYLDIKTKRINVYHSVTINQVSESEVIIGAFRIASKNGLIFGDNFTINASEPNVKSEGKVLDTSIFYWSDFTFVGPRLWAFRPSDYDYLEEGIGAIYIFNEDLSFYKRLRHNFGHVNTIEYNQSTDSLIFGNGSGLYDTDGEIYIIEGVKHWKNLE